MKLITVSYSGVRPMNNFKRSLVNVRIEKIQSVKEKINAALGIEINKDHLFVTDFENSRILIYDLKGKLLNSINKHLDHPTDLVIDRDTMYVINHGSASISVFERD